MNILVVDDEKEIVDLMEIYLKNDNFNVYKFYSSNNILSFLENTSIDLAILDVMMPDIDGFSLCKEIRKKYNFPIIFVTARLSDMDKISGLTIGADDYITKPFQPLELLARVKAQLRRYTKYNIEDNEDLIAFKNIIINNKTHECYINNQLIDLTPIQFQIFLELCHNRGNVVKNEDLFMKVWREKYYEKDNNTIMVHIRHLREKINKTGQKNQIIKTVWGVGYKIEK